MRSCVKIEDLRIALDAPPVLTGSQALDLGKQLIEKGAVVVAREAVACPRRGRQTEQEAR